jgi:hypothetical protein
VLVDDLALVRCIGQEGKPAVPACKDKAAPTSAVGSDFQKSERIPCGGGGGADAGGAGAAAAKAETKADSAVT